MQNSLKPQTKLLDASGRPIEIETAKATDTDLVEFLIAAGGGSNSLSGALAKRRMPARTLASDPFSHHPFVFSPINAITKAALTAPPRVYREKASTLRAHAIHARLNGDAEYIPGYGRKRAAMSRYVDGADMNRRISRADVEAVPRDPVQTLLVEPNAFQDTAAFIANIVQRIGMDGLGYVRLSGPDESDLDLNEDVAEMYVLPKHAVEPILERGNKGRMIGYKYTPLYCFPRAGEREIRVHVDEMIAMRCPHPSDPLDGWAAVIAALGSIDHDFALEEYARRLVENRANPSAVAEIAGDLGPDAAEQARKKWREVNSGSEGEIAFLVNGKYVRTGFSPVDLDAGEQSRRNREKILAPLGVAPSILGLSEYTNYTTKLIQSKVFWEITVLPILNLIARAFDRSRLFSTRPDSIFLDFDISNVEALRAGMDEKIDAVVKLCSASGPRVPPKIAFSMQNMDVPEYLGDDVSLVPTSLIPVAAAIADEPIGTPAPENEEDDDDPPAKPPDDDDIEGEELDIAASLRGSRAPSLIASKKQDRARQQLAFQRATMPIESKVRRGYRRWIDWAKPSILKNFDKVANEATSLRRGARFAALDLTRILPSLSVASGKLAAESHDALAAGLEETMKLTLDQIGIPVFEIDDERYINFWKNYETRYSEFTAKGLLNRLGKQVAAGEKAGETIQQIRLRVATVLDLASGSAKSLQIARTTTAGFMNGERNEMFVASGIKTVIWTNAGDEGVRIDHVKFANSGEQQLGFNFQEIAEVVTGGILEFPGDTRAPYGTLASCRCCTVPA